VYKQTL